MSLDGWEGRRQNIITGRRSLYIRQVSPRDVAAGRWRMRCSHNCWCRAPRSQAVHRMVLRHWQRHLQAQRPQERRNIEHLTVHRPSRCCTK
jgi:hypothetical protein